MWLRNTVLVSSQAMSSRCVLSVCVCALERRSLFRNARLGLPVFLGHLNVYPSKYVGSIGLKLGERIRGDCCLGLQIQLREVTTPP